MNLNHFTHFCKESYEPQKGDFVEVSDDGEKYLRGHNRIYTGFKNELGYLIVNCFNDAYFYKHIRLAKSPEQSKHEEAEKKAREFLDALTKPRPITDRYAYITAREALTEYIKTEGK